MTHFIGFLLALLIAVSTGLGATFLAVERGHGFDRIKIGSWSAWPRAGSPDADPYARAVISRTGEIPLSLGEGLVLQAERDEKGEVMNGSCTYSVSGDLPPSRFWTLTAYNRDGNFRENSARRYSFTSSEIIRNAAGKFEIILASEVKPGNWLPVSAAEPFSLMLRLYDTPLSSSATQIDPQFIPRIQKKSCS